MQNTKVRINITTDELRALITEAVKDAIPNQEQDQILNTAELAELLKYQPSYIRKLRRQGKIPFMGERSFRYSKNEVLEALKELGNESE